MKAPDVDVLIPVYNGERYLESSIASILAQNSVDVTVHVVNDGSTDRTEAILSQMAALDSRICIHSKPNSGIVDALNVGLSYCRSDFIARHDADDIAYPDRLASQLELLREKPDVVATGASARHIDGEGLFLGTFARFPDPDEADPNFVPAKEPYLLHPFLLVRREALLKVGGYRHVPHAEDTDLYWRLQEHGRLFSDRRVLGEYRMHTGSISGQSIANGRIMAISSQLCALSAARRRTSLAADMTFPASLATAVKASSSTMDAACAAASQELTVIEARHLRINSSAKLMDLTTYRPYELQLSDCRFIRSSFDEAAPTLTADSLRRLRRSLAGTAARLAHGGHRDAARALLDPKIRIAFLARLLTRRAVPVRVYARARRLLGPLIRTLRR